MSRESGFAGVQLETSHAAKVGGHSLRRKCATAMKRKPLKDLCAAGGTQAADAAARVALTGPTYGGWLTNAATFGGFELVTNLIAARLWHEQGETVRSLATVRRRVVGLGPRAVHVSQIRDEAHYAALIGDRDGATQAYRHYLALRANAELAVRPKVDEVSAGLHALQSDATDG